VKVKWPHLLLAKLGGIESITMTAEDLYDQIKAALKYFGLDWNQKDQIEVFFEEGAIIFRCGKESIRVQL
jgi:hypothetical protein